jgi:hypothetical protein
MMIILYEEDFKNVDIYRDMCDRLGCTTSYDKDSVQYPESIEINVSYGQPHQ